jgi:hypothetical protein
MDTLVKICKGCGLPKSVESFDRHPTMVGGRINFCRRCEQSKALIRNRLNKDKINQQQRERRKKNPCRMKGYDLKKNYGMSINDWNNMFEKQHGCCAICGKESYQFKKPLQVDYNHKSNKVRKLLCVRCNTAVGIIEDKEFRDRITKYLEDNN